MACSALSTLWLLSDRRFPDPDLISSFGPTLICLLCLLPPKEEIQIHISTMLPWLLP